MATCQRTCRVVQLERLQQACSTVLWQQMYQPGSAASEATAKSERMAAIQKQLEVVHAARKSANFDDTRDEDLITKYTTAIDNLNKQLLKECDLD